MRGVGFHAAGVALSVAATIIGLFAGALAGFFTSVCNDSPNVVAAHRHELQASVLCIGLGIAAAPALWAMLARKHQRAVPPWAAATGVVIVATLIATLTAKPTQWCLF